MKGFNKKIVIISLCFLAALQSNAQFTVTNDGMALVSIESGLTVSILGSYTTQTKATVDGKIDNQGTLQLTGNWTNDNSNTAPFNAFSTSAGLVTFDGTALQTIGGVSSTTFYDLRFNNDPAIAGDVTLAANNYTVNNQITMTRGNINLNSRTLTLGSSTVAPGTLSYTAGHMYGEGTFTRWISATAAAMGAIASNAVGHFPMGNSHADYRPLWVAYPGTNLSSGGTVSVLHRGDNYATNSASHLDATWNPPPAGTVLQGVSKSTWEVSSANGFAFDAANNGVIRFGGEGFDAFTLTDVNASLAASVAGVYDASTAVNTDLEVNRIGLSAANLGNTWHVGTKDITQSPLPVELLSFAAKPKERVVEVTWKTASELNADYFLVQHSRDGNVFEDVAQVQAAGNSSVVKSYTSIDYEPYADVSYYRLKQVDLDGQFEYSNVVAVNFNDNNMISVYPNPASKGEVFNVSITGKSGKKILIVVRDLQGREFYSKVFVLASENEPLAVDTQGRLSAGIYFIVASSDDKIYERKIVIK